MVTRVSVTVDDREPEGVTAALRDHPDIATVAVKRLPAGDLVIESVAVERKTLQDYVSSVMSRSGPDLEDQVSRMVDRYAHAYVLLEGNLDDIDHLRTGVSAEAIRGSMASITARHGTPVIPCADQRRLVDFAVRLGRKHIEEPSTRTLPAGSVPGQHEPTVKRMYACIEGIGPELAEALYEMYPTVAELLAASRDDLLAVEGIGEKRARTIRAALQDQPLNEARN